MIGYYVHHHGAGHLARATAIAAVLGDKMTLLGTGLNAAEATVGCDRVDLPDDLVADGFAGIDGVSRPSWLHYAPLHHAGVQQRNARIASWIAASCPALMVVDVSVEVACLARLCGVPTVPVRLQGPRADPPHEGAFRDALAVLAAFPAALEDPTLPAWLAAKTYYAGYIAAPIPPAAPRATEVVVLTGRGGTLFTAAAIAAAARATPTWRWMVLGAIDIAPNPPANLRHAGWVADPAALLSPASLLVAGAGDGTVALAAAIGCRLICIPQPRPYNEQHATAEALRRISAAIVRPAWPAAPDWPALLDEAATSNPAPLAALHDPQAAARAADALLHMARDGRYSR